MSMITIKRFLSLDTVDLDPAVVSAANSQDWPTAGDVADFAYKSLGTIWLLSGLVTSAALGKTIFWKRGEIAENASQEIVLLTLPEESYQNAEGLRNNNPGALDYYMDIIYKLPQGVEDFDRLYNTSLRVRYLLDSNWRSRRKAKPNHIKVVPIVDKATSPGIICRYLGNTYPPNGTEFVERWHVSQELIVPR